MKFLSDSFEYCAAVISSATEPQLRTPHNSPDGRMLGRDVLLIDREQAGHVTNLEDGTALLEFVIAKAATSPASNPQQ